MKKALILTGGWGGHEPKETAKVFSEILTENDFEVEVVENTEKFTDLEWLCSFDLFVPHWTMGKIGRTEERNICEAVARGTGIAGCHGGMCDAFRESTDWQFMTGAQWVAHPGNNNVTYEVNFKKSSSSPLIEGLEDFTLTSEQYYIHVDPCVDVLATTRFIPIEGEPYAANGIVEMPVIFTKRWGKGKVYYISIGHTAKIWEIPTAREAIRRGFLFAARG